MTQQQAFHGHVRGVVQGVFFRAATQEKARELGLTGWVRNADDGSVELLIAGDQASLTAMREWLGEGPPRARVDVVDLAPCEDPDLASFEVRA